MNANELADKLEDALDTDSWCQECALETTEPVARQAAAMLRQQQEEIEALKISLSGHSAEILSKNDETLPSGKYEPVAWMRQDFDGEWVEVMPGKGTPFYTQPAELSIETIEQIFFKLVDKDPWEHRNEKFYIEFARAILRKAQEK